MTLHQPLPGLGRVGLFCGTLDQLSVGHLRDTVAEIDELGYGTLWWSEAVGRETFTQALLVLGATSRLVAATGIANVWARDATAANAAARTLIEAHPDRFLLGLGISHGPLIDSVRGEGRVYEKPLARMSAYLDAMDSAVYTTAGSELPRPPRLLAALGPRMLDLAREKAEGALTYLVTPEHTARARAALGAGSLLAVEQAVVLTADRETGLRRGRAHLEFYLGLPNYLDNLKRLGFTEADFADGLSDRLVEALVVWGDEDAVRAAVTAHREAGADHVCLQVLGETAQDLRLDDLRTLAPALLS
ncbi:TIGR03620 family F420-dependent LLM class oxidoreductase [Streptomyces jumonjinensis]|uniref:TIGR03620 family F420-dependent LLM class oxidoreductase n=1 Tax=Streptomyces jumonjinensis TaxID=1945 RepID=A0A646KMN0_STRJU|nr:TIGR03620 family F420-dependent LLM class oxidoreductase [Streptomyces jumonjinensis]MQT03328.1 TIGR03620 family F420-dependent LLM class oxidoreductase [Streptomyces jumonjinensis]